MEVPYIDLAAQHKALKEELLVASDRVFESGWFILGPEVEQFEAAFTKLCGVQHAVGVSNGTAALMLAMRALGIGEGDEVITAPNSFLASASSVALIGATPKFCDVGPDYNLDPEKLEAAITTRTKAIMPVHLTGRPAPMDAIMEIAKQHDLKVIEDCAQAVGAKYNDRPVGSIGDVGTFSLHPLKNLNACGDGGVIITNDDAIADHLRLARNHGLKNRDECSFWSTNSRLDALQAALASVKLPYLKGWTEKRRANAAYYQKHLSDLLHVPSDASHEYSVYHTCVIQTDERDKLQSYLKEKGVGTAIHYPIPIHLQKAAKSLGYAKGDFSVAEQQAERILSLPVYPELSEEKRAYVVECIRSFF